MALGLTRETMFQRPFIRSYSLGFLLASEIWKDSPFLDHSRNYRNSLFVDKFFRKHQPGTLQHFSTHVEHQGLCWGSSSHSVLLRKLELALKDHQVDEEWVTFNDFKSLHGFPSDSVVSRLITQLSYSSDHCWLRKACDLVFIISKQKPCLVMPEVLSKLSLSLARAQLPVLASLILRMMLDRESMPPVNMLWLVFFHLVKSEIGTCIASNLLVQICDCFLRLSANQGDKATMVKPDTMMFNLVLDACVRYKSSLKGQLLVELMSQAGVVADAHSIIIMAQIHEINGQRDEIKKFKEHVDRVSSPFVSHYWPFYDCLLNLHFKFDDIDAAVELVLEMHTSRESVTSQNLKGQVKKPYLVPIGSQNLRAGLKIQVLPELLNKDSILKLEHKQELVIFRNGKLLLSERGLAKLIKGCRRHDKITILSKLLFRIQNEYKTTGGSNLCSDVIDACIHLGWFETAHDILDDMETAGAPIGLTTYMSLFRAYSEKGMLKEANALLRQMRKAGLVMNLPDEVVASSYLSETADIRKSNLADILVLEMREENAILPMVYDLNSSIYFFCKAKMKVDALKTYRRMQDIKIKPTVQTFAYLVNGYSSVGSYRDITILWGDIKRYTERTSLKVTRDLYELLLLNFIRGGYFERVMEVIEHMKERNMYTDRGMYRSEFLRLHKNLYKNLNAIDAKTEAQNKRLGYVRSFRKWVGID